MEEKRKGISVPIFIIAIIIFLILGLVGGVFLSKEYLNKEAKKTTEKTTNETTNYQDVSKLKLDLTEEDKIEYNRQLEKILYPLQRIISDFDKLEYNISYFDTNKKINFVWQMIEDDKSTDTVHDIDIDGSEATGALYMKTEYFINNYKKVTNENINENDILNTNKYKLKNGNMYGDYETGRGLDTFILKTEKLSYLKNNNYQLEISYLTSFEEKKIQDYKELEYNDEIIQKYKDPEITDYPEEMKKATLLINFLYDGNEKFIKDIVLKEM